MTLLEIIKSIKEEKLDKYQLEGYRDKLAELQAQLKLDIATCKKERAIFMLGKEKDESVAGRKIAWEASPSGQKLITLEGYSGSCLIMLSNLRDRIYQVI